MLLDNDDGPALVLGHIRRSAVLSSCGAYRFTLTRRWDQRPMLVVWMFNPSTADEEIDDPTIRLLCQIASHNGYGGIVVVNWCPLRSSTPEPAFDMLARTQVDGDLALRAVMWKNFEAIEDTVRSAGDVLVAWGAMGHKVGDWMHTGLQLLREMRPRPATFHLGLCQNGHPKHPLARGKHKVPEDAPLLDWRVPA